MRILCVCFFAFSFSSAAICSPSIGVKLHSLVGPTIELGYTNSQNHYYYGSFGGLSLDLIEVSGVDIGSSRSTSENNKHWVGISAGRVKAGPGDDYWFFDGQKVKLPNLKINYTYYFQSTSTNSFLAGVEAMWVEGAIAPLLEIGYRFNF